MIGGKWSHGFPIMAPVAARKERRFNGFMVGNWLPAVAHLGTTLPEWATGRKLRG
jgi:hypothetical protein